MTVWLDVTSTMSWFAKPIGIVRVQVNLALQLIERVPDLRFCIYRNGRPYLVSRNAVEDRIAAILSHRSEDSQRPANPRIDSSSHANPTSAKSRLKLTLIRWTNAFGRRLPGSVARDFESSVRATWYALRELKARARLAYTSCRLGRTLRILAGCLMGKYRGGEREEIETHELLTAWRQLDTEHTVSLFGAGDIFVTIGGDWDGTKDFCKIYAQKQATGFKVIAMCHDILPIKSPHYFLDVVPKAFTRYFSDLAWVADHIVCNSACTRKDLVQFFQTMSAPTPATSIITLGSDFDEEFEGEIDPRVAKLLAAETPFILFVSTFERRKNHEVIYRAYSRLRERAAVDPNAPRDLPLVVCVGSVGWKTDELRDDIARDPLVAGLIHHVEGIGDGDLIQLYRRCLFSVYPSLYEGWGLPVAESLANGKLCLSSNRGSLPEVGGDLVEYLDPWNVEQWAEAIVRYASTPELLREKEERIRREYQPPSWNTAGAQFAAVIDQVRAGEGTRPAVPSLEAQAFDRRGAA